MGDSTTTTVVPDGGNATEQTGGSAVTDTSVVEVRLPADSSFVSLLRTTTASLAARSRFNVDEIEDLRIAIDEACAMLMSAARPGVAMTCRFELHPDVLEIRAAVPSDNATVPSRNSFGWTVLSALAGGADAGFNDGELWIALHKRRHSTDA